MAQTCSPCPTSLWEDSHQDKAELNAEVTENNNNNNNNNKYPGNPQISVS
jgi:hypothetical protein